jgi:hypothetical protein
MVEKIKVHNYLNGFVFSLVEFLIVFLFLAPFMIYYFLHGRLLFGIIALGIGINSLLIVVFAANSIRKKEKDFGIGKLFNKKTWLEINRKYPGLQRDTYVLSALIILLFMLTLFCFLDLLKTHKRRSN